MESFCVSLESMSESQDIWEQEEILESCLYLDPSRIRSKTDSICKEAQVSYENRTELATQRRSLLSDVHTNDCKTYRQNTSMHRNMMAVKAEAYMYFLIQQSSMVPLYIYF